MIRFLRKTKLYFFRWYSVLYLRAKHTEFADVSSVKFNGRCSLKKAKDSELTIGKYFTCNSGMDYAIDASVGSKIWIYPDAKLIFGDYSGMSNTAIICSERIEIGDYVNLGAGCLIVDTNFHSTKWEDRLNWATDAKNTKTAPVVIKDGAFIGARSIILKGVTIGAHSIIAAGSVVNKDVPDNCIAGGNPCRVIGPVE